MRFGLRSKVFVLLLLATAGTLAAFFFANRDLVPAEQLNSLIGRTSYVAALSFFIVLGLSVLLVKPLTSDLERLTDAAEKMSHGEFTPVFDLHAGNETAGLAQNLESAAEEIERLVRRSRDQAMVQADSRTSRAMQATLLPSEDWSSGGFEVAGFYRSAGACAGDWWAYRSHGDTVHVVIGDVTERGISAGMVSSAAQAAFGLAAGADASVEDVAAALNLVVHESGKGRAMMSAIFVRLRISTGEFDLINCSHEFPFIQRGPGPRPECLVGASSKRLGENRSLQTRVESGRLDPGHAMVLYSNGLTALCSPEGRTFGERSLIQSIARATGSAANRTQQMARILGEHSQGTDLQDDVTMVVIHHAGSRLT